MSHRRTVMMTAALLCGGCFVPQQRFDQQKLETDSCYSALERENERKRELAAAVADLQAGLDALAAERKRLSAEKGTLASNLVELEQQVAARMHLINRLTAEKARLQEERDQLASKTETYDELVSSLQEEMKQRLIEVKRQGQRITVNVSDQVLFDSGSAQVKQSGQGSLEKIAKVLAKVHDRRIDVEGHTDDVPITGELAKTFPTNWELSTARATNVLRFLESKGVDSKRLAAVGMSMYRPLASNKTAKGRQLNRRIDIVLTPWESHR